MLSEDQKQFFDAFGYLVLRDVFSAEEMATIKRESDEIFREGLGVRLPTGQGGACSRSSSDGLSWRDSRRTTGSTASGRTCWGRTSSSSARRATSTRGIRCGTGRGLWDETVKSVKIAFYPESLTAATGSLRVVPGSHRRSSPDLLEPLRHGSSKPDSKPFGMEQSEVPSVALELRQGDLAVFTEHILHAAFGGHDGRHQHAINFMENPTTESKEKDVRDFYEVSNYSLRPSESYVNSDNPRLRRMVEKNLELGFDIMKGV